MGKLKDFVNNPVVSGALTVIGLAATVAGYFGEKQKAKDDRQLKMDVKKLQEELDNLKGK